MQAGEVQQTFQWWCSAQGKTWSWRWVPYPGVWIFLLICISTYWFYVRSLTKTQESATTRSSRLFRTGSAIAGFAALWLTLDWPIGALGSGYLASAHAVQFVMLAIVVPVALLGGLPPSSAEHSRGAPPSRGLRMRAGSPFVSMLLFMVVMVATHAPMVVDSWMKSQVGAFLLDMLWFLSGLIFWIPVIRGGISPAVKILYVFLGGLPHTFIAMWLLLATYPVYSTYELAPRITGVIEISARNDQQLAGGILILIAGSLMLLAISIIFFRWQGWGAEPSTDRG